MTIARYPRACRSPSRCATSVGLPCADPQDRELEIEPFGELRQLELHAPGDGVAQLAERPGGGPGERVGERLRFLVRRGGAVQRSARLREDDPRPVGQELGGRREPVEEERRRGFHPLGMQTVRDPLQEVGEPVGLANRLGCGSCPDVAVRDQLPDRAHLHMGQSRGGELRRRGELAERLDLVAPVLEAHRPARDAREDVEHAAADGELATVLDDVDAAIPELDELFGQLVGREVAPGDQLDRGHRAERRDQALHRGEGRRDQDGRAAMLAEAPDGRRPPGGDVRRRRDALVGQCLPGREQRNVARKERLEVLHEGFCLVGTGSHGEHRRVQRHRQPGHDERLARLGPGLDRPLLRQQETLEGLRSDEPVQGFPQAHASAPRRAPNNTNSPGRDRDGASWSSVRKVGPSLGLVSVVCSATPSARGTPFMGGRCSRR